VTAKCRTAKLGYQGHDMLDQVRMGDQVKFNVEELNGAMTVAALEVFK